MYALSIYVGLIFVVEYFLSIMAFWPFFVAGFLYCKMMFRLPKFARKVLLQNHVRNSYQHFCEAKHTLTKACTYSLLYAPSSEQQESVSCMRIGKYIRLP